MNHIYCRGCKLYLGEIRDAKLRKNIVYLCRKCEIKRVASDISMKNKPKDPVNDFIDKFVNPKIF